MDFTVSDLQEQLTRGKTEFEARIQELRAQPATSELASQIQNLTDRATAAEAKAAEQSKTSQAAIEAIGRRLLDNEIKISAGTQVMDEESKTVKRLAFLPAAMDEILLLIDRKAITEKDGRYDGIETALDALAKTKPHLTIQAARKLKGKGTPNSDDPAQGNNQQPKVKSVNLRL